MHRATKLEDLKYAFTMLLRIRRRIAAADEEFLTYLIDIAAIEAGDRAQEVHEETEESRS